MKKTTHNTAVKDFDAVKMMRSIRDSLSKRWINNPEVMKRDLEHTRKKYKKYFEN